MEITGLSDMLNVLEKAGPRHARNLMRATVHAIAGEIAKESKSSVKVKTGNLKKAIKTKRKKSPPTAPVSDVIVTMGKSKKNDGFYWRFVENGTKKMNARPFVKPAVETINAKFVPLMREHFGKKLEQALKREAKRLNK